MAYATTTMLADILGIKRAVPSWDVEATPTNEAVGTGDDSTTQFWLDQQNILAGSYTLYANAVAMTETTHYTLNKDTGEITLTSAGVTLLSTNALTAKYDYINNGMSDSYLTTVLSRADVKIDNMLNTAFTDGTAANPDYLSETEIQSSEGIFRDRIIVDKKPLKDIKSTLGADITAAAATIGVATGEGTNFPSSGTIIIGTEVITYTGVSTDDLTGCARGELGTTAAVHSSGDDVHTTVLFRSATSEGTAVSWTVQAWDTAMYATAEGLIYKFEGASPDPLIRRGVLNRIKIIYYYGHDTIPLDIQRLSLLLGKKMLIQDNVGKSMIAGRDEFRPEMFAIDKKEIAEIVSLYIVIPMGNT